MYQSDGSGTSDAAGFLSKVADGKDGIYTHASVEINQDMQFTANGKGSHVIETNRDILGNANGNKARLIDIYRHKNSSRFDGDAATYHAAKANISDNGLYGARGYCSQRTQEGLRAGGLNHGDHGISTPNDFSRDSNFNHVGRYNTREMRSE